MNINIISRSQAYAGANPTVIIWDFEVSPADYLAFGNAYVASLPSSPFPVSFSSVSTIFNTTSQLQWLSLDANVSIGPRIRWIIQGTVLPAGFSSINSVINISFPTVFNTQPINSHVRQFTIPSPIISNPTCEYFSIQFRKIQPIISAWQSMPNVVSNSFSLYFDFNSIYEIQAHHHCCDGNDSDPITTTFNATTNNPMIYACIIETVVSDTCATTAGNCRNCQVRKSYKVRFYSNPSGTNQINLPNNIQLRIQETVNGITQLYYTTQASAGNNELQLWTRVTYEETCISGNSQVSTLAVSLLDGQFEQFPYTVISCISNNPTLTEISNTSTGAGGIRTQVFKVGNDILAGNKFQASAYSVTKNVLAITGDTPTSVAQKLANSINTTTASQWNASGSAPTNQNGFKPQATSSGSNLTITLNHQNSFVAYAYEH